MHLCSYCNGRTISAFMMMMMMMMMSDFFDGSGSGTYDRSADDSDLMFNGTPEKQRRLCSPHGSGEIRVDKVSEQRPVLNGGTMDNKPLDMLKNNSSLHAACM